MKKSILVFVIILLLATACANVEAPPVPEETAVAQIVPTETDTPTAVPPSTPTFTPTATPTDIPTNTSTPSPTATYTPTPTATAVGGGGQILFQMPRHLYDPEANTVATELFAINSDGADLHPITEGFNRYVWQGIPSPDRRHTLLITYATLPINLFENPRLDIVGADGSFETVGFLSASSPTVYWLDDGRFVYLSNQEGGTTGAYIAAPGNDDIKRVSPPEHNVIRLLPVSDDIEKIHYFKGSISRESLEGGGTTNYITPTGLYWAAIDSPIDDLMWDRIEDHYFHVWDLQVDDQAFQISTNYNVSEIFPTGQVQVRVSNSGLPEESEDLWDSNIVLHFDELSSLENPPEEIPGLPEFPDSCGNLTFSPDGTKMVVPTYKKTDGGGPCPGGPITIWNFEEKIAVPLEGYTDFGNFSPDGKHLLIYGSEPDYNASIYNLEDETITNLPESEEFFAYMFSPDGRTILAYDRPGFWDTSTSFLPVLLDIESQETRSLLPDFEEIETEPYILMIDWLP